ncbi:hypothetical protein PLEOSDRAFT_1099549 [Pleurotus ostreatus PC15]|uniref:Enoyl reductase (ER) domain-containing protein n=1 Tax=Pleurotus ostreatus (strain PC15) TaxID=1137138 RepID=A0A067P096_PLEO1|nr:hypothetical protein PLEOSDRAFT_1099549 [Pleurotus ostreatus PC15]
MPTPKTQRAWVSLQRGHPSRSLSLKSDWPVAGELKKDDVLIRIQAAALNPVGYKMMRLLPNFMAGRPLVVEHDFAGVVEDGNDTEFKAGDPVFGFIHVFDNQKSRQGSLSEYAVVPAAAVALRPPTIDVSNAAGIALAGLTAYQALFKDAGLEPGQKVFINGGSTAVGLFAIQIAKAHGMTVVASASSRNEGLVKEMGADEFIDYTKEPLHQYLSSHPPEPKFHAIIDAFGLSDPSLYTHSPQYLAPQGVFVTTGPFPHSTTISEFFNAFLTIVATARPVWLGGVNRKYKLAAVMVDKADLNALSQLIAEGKLKGVVDSVYPMEDALKGYERLMTSRAAGKVVIKIDPSVQ